MIIQWINRIGWVLLFAVPNYSYIIENFQDLIKPAFSAIAWFIPIVSASSVFKFCYTVVNDTLAYRKSVFDYGGIDLSDKKKAADLFISTFISIITLPHNSYSIY